MGNPSIFQTLYAESNGFLELRALKGKGDKKVKKQEFFRLEDASKIKAFVQEHTRKGFDLYFGVATRDGSSGKKDAVVSVPAVWCDIDFKETPKDVAEKKLSEFPLHPTIIVESGGGLHVYWKLKEPYGKEDMAVLESTMRRIAITFDSDMSATEIARILRIPNTKNFKYHPPRPVVLRHCNGSEYNLDDFDEFLPSIEQASKTVPAAGDYKEQSNVALDAIMTCEFMQLCKNNAATLSEPQWYAMLTQIVRETPGGPALAHKLSKPYPKYNRAETDAKILQIYNSTGPWSCAQLREKGFVRCEKDCGVKSPAGLAYKLTTKEERDEQLKNSEYFAECFGENSGDEVNITNPSNPSNPSKPNLSKQNQATQSKNQASAKQASKQENGDEKPCESGSVQWFEHNECGQNEQSESKQSKQSKQENQMIQERGFTAELREWITNSVGSFSVWDIDREFNLKTRQEKNARSWSLNKYIKEKLILKDRAKRGIYHVLSDDVTWIDPFKASADGFKIHLPLGLNDMLEIPSKSIVVVAGATNAGKTALLLNIAAMNLHPDQSTLYLMSEMGPSEYRKRLERFRNIPPAVWLRMKCAERSTGFNSVIWNHNRKGITFVDFLEDISGEYFKLASGIREIYDALDDGVAVVALQKKKDQAYGRGGESTAEKARLYLSLDSLVQSNDFSICSLKIVKAKDYKGANCNGKEIHFKLFAGTKIEAISQWQWLTDQQRDGIVKSYQRQYGERTPF